MKIRSVLLIGVLSATFMLALVSCNETAEPPTSPPVAPTEPYAPTPRPEYLEETVPPCIQPLGSTVDPCGTSLTAGDSTTEDIPIGDAPKEFSEYLAGFGSRTPHIVVRGTFLPNTVRCDSGYTYVRAPYLRPSGWPLDGNPLLHCFQDVRVNEYIVGTGPSVLTLQMSHDLYFPSTPSPAALDAFENLWERILNEGGHTITKESVDRDPLLDGVTLDILDRPTYTGIEGMLFVGPSPNASTQAWQAMALWQLEQKDDGTVVAVHPEREYFPMEGNESVLELTLPVFKQKAVAAQANRVAANAGRTQPGTEFPMLLTDANNLRQFFVEIGSYDDPANPPGQPIPAYECDNTTAVTSPGSNRGLVQDCESLLDSKDTLRGTASLNWSAGTAVTGWDGVTVTSDRIAKVELDDESLSGTIPPALGNLPSLTHLDLSDNALTGAIPRELAYLENLQVLSLSGNSLTGCIPEGLKDVATNDLNSLNLQDCPAAPSDPRVGTPGEASVPLAWSAVPNAAKYRVEYRVGSRGEWALDYRDRWSLAEVPTGTSHTVTSLVCRTDYRVRVRAYGDGTNISAEWGSPSESVSGRTATCVSPVFDEESYSLNIPENADIGAAVGTVSATDPQEDDTVTYSITHGNDDGKFAIGATGAITVAAVLDFEDTPSYILTVQASDGTNSSTVQVEITVTDANDAPVFEEESYEFSISETIGDWVYIGDLDATDQDGDAITYSLGGAGAAPGFRLPSPHHRILNGSEPARTVRHP